MIDEVADDLAGMDEAAAEAETVAETATDVRSGNAAVDDVLVSLEALPDLPLEEHLGVFERAHELLRDALDGPRET